MDRGRILSELSKMQHAEAAKLFTAVFSGSEGQKALMYIMVKIGGLGQLRGKASNTDAQERLRLDGKQEAALEIMALAGFSPFDMALRVLDLKPLNLLKDLENETESPASDKKRRRSGRGPTAPGPVSERPGYAGDPEPESPEPATDAAEPARESPDAEFGGD